MTAPRNRIELEGEVEGEVRRGATPAGVAVVRFLLRHRSVQTEAGGPVRIGCRIPVVACGPAAAAEPAAGARVRVTGFLAEAPRGGLALRAQRIEILDDERDGRAPAPGLEGH